jgi:IclR family acetate operon transcriptional repressor
VTATREPVHKAIEVLKWMADHPDGHWGLRQIARDTGITPPTVHRILQLFEARNLVSRDTDGNYTGGLELHHVGRGLASAVSFVTIARPLMAALAEECHETVLLGSYDYRLRQMRFIDMIEATYPLRYVVELQQPMPIHAGATGLAILAFLDVEERQSIYRDGLPRLTDMTLSDVGRIEEEIALIRDRGFVCTHGQRIDGAVGLASPVFDAVGKVIGDVCVTIPAPRFAEEQQRYFERIIRRTAAELTNHLEKAGLRANSTETSGQQGVADDEGTSGIGRRSA